MRRQLQALALTLTLCALTAVMGFASLPRAGGQSVSEAGAPDDTLIVPVRGVEAADLQDSWGAPRSGGRVHEGVDIMAPMHTPVLAAADGRIAKLHESARGGLAIYQQNEDGRLVMYYAHLSRYAAELREGDAVRQGQVIAFVGETGNATTPHLHFELQRLDPEADYWRGEAVNAYAYLRDGRVPAQNETHSIRN